MDIKYFEQIKRNVHSNCGCNVGIFIDYDNIYHGFRNFGCDVEDENYNIITTLWSIYDKSCVRIIKAYADFEQVKVKLKTLQKDRVNIKQVYGNGKGEKYRKNASDIELSIEATECIYTNPEIDTYVFVTADSDMIPIMSRLMFKGKRVHLFYIGANSSQYQDITKYAHTSIDLVDLYNIDVNLNKPETWKYKALEVIQKWYENDKNATKLLGSSWLNKELTENLSISVKLAGDIIQYLLDSELIENKEMMNNEKKVNGYVIKQ